jgi:hypothetical protein
MFWKSKCVLNAVSEFLLLVQRRRVLLCHVTWFRRTGVRWGCCGGVRAPDQGAGHLRLRHTDAGRATLYEKRDHIRPEINIEFQWMEVSELVIDKAA